MDMRHNLQRYQTSTSTADKIQCKSLSSIFRNFIKN